MVVICLGPVCVPLHLLIPFLLSVLHKYGWFTWIKREWVTLRWWKHMFRLLYYRLFGGEEPLPPPGTGPKGPTTPQAPEGDNAAAAGPGPPGGSCCGSSKKETELTQRRSSAQPPAVTR